MNLHLLKDDLLSLEKRYRAQLLNHVSGYKSAQLLGTQDAKGHTNLAVFNSLMHIGANPPLIGILSRPLTVTRHSYDNLKETGYYTLNAIHEGILAQAHQCSAKYEKGQSEFAASGLSEEYIEGFGAPFVKESHIKMGLKYVEEYKIEANGTILVIGEIQHLILPKAILAKDGFVRLAEADTVAISGLDAYHQVSPLKRYSYARPDQDLDELGL